MKFNIAKEYFKGLQNSILYLLYYPDTTIEFPLDEWFSNIKKDFDEELYNNIINAKSIDSLHDFYSSIVNNFRVNEYSIVACRLEFGTSIFNNCVKNTLYDKYELTNNAQDHIRSLLKHTRNGNWGVEFIEKYKKENNIVDNKNLSSEIEFDKMSYKNRELESKVEKLRNQISNLKSENSKLLKENEDLKKRIEELATTQISQNENKTNTTYEINNEQVISYIFNTLKDNAFSLSNAQFSTLVERADFSSIYGTIKGNKAKIKHMISCLSICMENGWYKAAAKSIGIQPKDCSGAHVSEYIKNKLNKRKIQEIINKKQ